MQWEAERAPRGTMKPQDPSINAVQNLTERFERQKLESDNTKSGESPRRPLPYGAMNSVNNEPSMRGRTRARNFLPLVEESEYGDVPEASQPSAPPKPATKSHAGKATENQRPQSIQFDPEKLQKFKAKYGPKSSVFSSGAGALQKRNLVALGERDGFSTSLYNRLDAVKQSQSGFGGGAALHPPIPPELQVHRNVTDPTKIIKLTETPGAPQRAPRAHGQQPDRTSPTPRGSRHAAPPSFDSPDEREEKLEDYDKHEGGSDDWVRPPSPERKDTTIALRGTTGLARQLEKDWDRSSPPVHNVTTVALREQRVPILQAPPGKALMKDPFGVVPKVGAGAVTSRLEVHTAPEGGIDVTTARYAVPDDHSERYVRGEQASLKKMAPPPQAFFVRSRVPICFKDSALTNKERADKFHERLNAVEKQMGVCGRYSNESYGRAGTALEGSQPLRLTGAPHRGFQNRGRSQGGRFGAYTHRDRYGGHHPHDRFDRYNRQLLANGHAAHPSQNNRRSSAALLLKAPPGPRTVAEKAEEVVDEVAAAEVVGNEQAPEPQDDAVWERRLVHIIGLLDEITVGHVLRSLGNTGRIEEIYEGHAKETGRFIGIKFANQLTAAMFAERENLPIHMSPEWTEMLEIQYQPATEVLTGDGAFVLQELDSRILIIGPCPADYFISAYVEYAADHAELKAALVDYLCDMIHGVSPPESKVKFLDINMESRGQMLKAILSYRTIRTAVEAREGVKTINTFRGVRIECGQDPCQGDEECDRLGIFNRHLLPDFDMEQAERDERNRVIDRERRRFQRMSAAVDMNVEEDPIFDLMEEERRERIEYLQMELNKGLGNGNRSIVPKLNNHRAVSRAARGYENTPEGLHLAIPPPIRGVVPAQQRQPLSVTPSPRGFSTTRHDQQSTAQPLTREAVAAHQGSQPPSFHLWSTAAQRIEPSNGHRSPANRVRRDQPRYTSDRAQGSGNNKHATYRMQH